jgi:hypothetical protein
MSIFEKAVAYDYCVYWPPKKNASNQTATDRYGNQLFDDAVELKCRWDDVRQIIKSTDGTDRQSNAEVITDQLVELGGVLWHGRLAEAPRTPPLENTILVVETITNLKKTKTIWFVYA